MNATPSFQEDHLSQVPALQLLQNLGFTYLRPQEVHLQRKGKLSSVLLEGILADHYHPKVKLEAARPKVSP